MAKFKFDLSFYSCMVLWGIYISQISCEDDSLDWMYGWSKRDKKPKTETAKSDDLNPWLSASGTYDYPEWTKNTPAEDPNEPKRKTKWDYEQEDNLKKANIVEKYGPQIAPAAPAYLPAKAKGDSASKTEIENHMNIGGYQQSPTNNYAPQQGPLNSFASQQVHINNYIPQEGPLNNFPPQHAHKNNAAPHQGHIHKAATTKPPQKVPTNTIAPKQGAAEKKSVPHSGSTNNFAPQHAHKNNANAAPHKSHIHKAATTKAPQKGPTNTIAPKQGAAERKSISHLGSTNNFAPQQGPMNNFGSLPGQFNNFVPQQGPLVSFSPQQGPTINVAPQQAHVYPQTSNIGYPNHGGLPQPNIVPPSSVKDMLMEPVNNQKTTTTPAAFDFYGWRGVLLKKNNQPKTETKKTDDLNPWLSAAHDYEIPEWIKNPPPKNPHDPKRLNKWEMEKEDNLKKAKILQKYGQDVPPAYKYDYKDNYKAMKDNKALDSRGNLIYATKDDLATARKSSYPTREELIKEGAFQAVPKNYYDGKIVYSKEVEETLANVDQKIRAEKFANRRSKNKDPPKEITGKNWLKNALGAGSTTKSRLLSVITEIIFLLVAQILVM